MVRGGALGGETEGPLPSTRGDSHQGERRVAGPLAKANVAMRRCHLPGWVEERKEMGRMWMLNCAQKPAGGVYVPQHPRRANCPRPPATPDTWGQGDEGALTRGSFKDPHTPRPANILTT